MYTMTVLSFFVGACIGCVSVYTYGAYGAFIGFVPLIVARLFMYIGKIPVENGTPEETEEEAKEALEEAGIHHATLEFEDERATCCKECCED